MRCTAISKQSGNRCRKQALKGKDKCDRHGGKAKIETGLHSKYRIPDPKLQALIDKFNADPTYKNLQEELAIQRALLQRYLTFKIKDMEVIKANRHISEFVESIRGTVTAISRIEDGLRLTLSVQQVDDIMKQVFNIISDEVEDPKTLERIAGKLVALTVGEGMVAGEAVLAERRGKTIARRENRKALDIEKKSRTKKPKSNVSEVF